MPRDHVFPLLFSAFFFPSRGWGKTMRFSSPMDSAEYPVTRLLLRRLYTRVFTVTNTAFPRLFRFFCVTDTFIAAAAIYQSIYRNQRGAPATFQVFLSFFVLKVFFWVLGHAVAWTRGISRSLFSLPPPPSKPRLTPSLSSIASRSPTPLWAGEREGGKLVGRRGRNYCSVTNVEAFFVSLFLSRCCTSLVGPQQRRNKSPTREDPQSFLSRKLAP